ncbi:Tenascin-like protein [Phytophthora palmivora]|uniref:Tenascin-like protein n=1 Tax=Phytophthora palmivora TaxID=4796 RepID=A0A2P4YL86_9STRA|nr:Tenascin-like protein [Phytophthora palmivora]
MQCPNDCSGHGTCEFIEELAADTYHKKIGGTSGRTYQLWDQEKIMGCVCDPNYEGHDCSLRSCPKGDDPLTPNQFDMVQAIVINKATSTGKGYLTYNDPYGNTYTTETIAFNFASNAATCAAIETALRRLPNNVLNTVNVEVSARFYAIQRTDPTDPTGVGKSTKVFNDDNVVTSPFLAWSGTGARDKTICEVQFTSEPGTTGYQNLLECNIAKHDTAGQHPISIGVTTAGATCTVYEVYPMTVVTDDTNGNGALTDEQIADNTLLYRPLTELTECSGRGTCDYSTGTCQCFAGHMGLACQKQEALV